MQNSPEIITAFQLLAISTPSNVEYPTALSEIFDNDF